MALANQFVLEQNTTAVWREQITILKEALCDLKGEIYFEFSIPRMGKRIDCLLIIQNIVFVVEFKVGEAKYKRQDYDQVWDYALDLKNFHEPSHDACILPILVATQAGDHSFSIIETSHADNLYRPICVNKNTLAQTIKDCLAILKEQQQPLPANYIEGSYTPTPTIIEAAIRLYNNHSVKDITRSSAEAINLRQTNAAIDSIIQQAKQQSKKVICFVTGVPGAGKTLVGLNVATSHLDKAKGDSSVFLSGNAPLVAILQEALTRDKVNREKAIGNKVTKSSVKDSVKAFIQIIHHYRDAYLVDKNPPYDHVAIFDEAQRAWNKEQTVSFMIRKKGQANFDYSEPEFLISCLDRHQDWAVIICLVGGGQEINTGEAGISEWLRAIENHFQHWEVAISPYLLDAEYGCTSSNRNNTK